ncbi:hypothetical protein AP058_00818 [Flavobacterium sp. TAB 87]|nr:hypothetical protein AP058_00818 [Flavobacterium sp. TAB 87]
MTAFPSKVNKSFFFENYMFDKNKRGFPCFKYFSFFLIITVLLFGGALTLVRLQSAVIGDIFYMKG